jgi:serine protease AprX
LLLVASLALPVPLPPGPPDAPSIASFLSSRTVVVLVQGGGAVAAVAAAGGQALADLPIVNGLLARVPAAGMAWLARWPGVRAVTPADRPLEVGAAEPSQGPRQAGAAPGLLGGLSSLPDLLAGAGAGGDGVGVGVLDTGIASAGDLTGRVVASVDLSGEWSFSDAYGHGTFMAGLIAGSGHGGGPAGVAPGVDLVDLKVAGADGATTLGQVLLALQLADANRERFNLRVLNVSLGAPADDPATAPLTEAVERLWADGITVVTAAGNDGGGVDAPGLDPYVLTVGALDPAQAGGAVPAWSSRGRDFAGRPKPDLVAPGVGLVGLRAPGSTVDLANPAARVGEHYFRGSGTSMSTALVAGAAARVAAAHPGWGPDQVKAALTGSAGALGQPPPAGAGAGALDLEAALGVVPAQPANGELFPLRPVGRTGTPRAPVSLEELGWRPGGDDGLRWTPAAGLPGRTPGAGDVDAWTAHPWLSGRWAPDGAAAKSWAAQQWLARAWAARQWSAAGLQPTAWAALQWSWGGLLAATLGGRSSGAPANATAADWAARSWVARSWAQRVWGPGDLAARSWAARSWAQLDWTARSWAARSWADVDWTAQSWAARRWSAGAWAARSWSAPRAA